jgi:small-conductance mechanosensitive channel
MELSLNAPALLFPTISLLILAYTNRFLAIASLVRSLHKEYNEEHNPKILAQIKNLRLRLTLIQNMQAIGVICIFFAVLSMYLIVNNKISLAIWVFGASLVLLMVSLTILMIEIYLSTNALRIELADIEEKIAIKFFPFPRRKSSAEQEDEEI